MSNWKKNNGNWVNIDHLMLINVVEDRGVCSVQASYGNGSIILLHIDSALEDTEKSKEELRENCQKWIDDFMRD